VLSVATAEALGDGSIIRQPTAVRTSAIPRNETMNFIDVSFGMTN